MWNVLADNNYVQVFCSNCNNYLCDLYTHYRKNIFRINCSKCSLPNYPYRWIERPIVKNPDHPENTTIFYDRLMMQR
jgi:hypothetical protein